MSFYAQDGQCSEVNEAVAWRTPAEANIGKAVFSSGRDCIHSDLLLGDETHLVQTESCMDLAA